MMRGLVRVLLAMIAALTLTFAGESAFAAPRAEKRACSAETSLLATNFEILRSRREKLASPLIRQARAVFRNVPKKAREWIATENPKHSQALLENYASTTPRGAWVRVDPARAKIVYRYVVSGQAFAGEIPIHATYEEDEAAIQAQIVSPEPGGWPAYQRKTAMKACPLFVELAFTATQALSSDCYGAGVVR